MVGMWCVVPKAIGGVLLLFTTSYSFHIVPQCHSLRIPPEGTRFQSKAAAVAKRTNPRLPTNQQSASTTIQDQTQEIPAKKICLYKNSSTEDQWKERIELKDLKFGQELNGVVVQRLLDGKTGPKVFLDCGIGRMDGKGDWQIVNAMLRLVNSRKSSVAQKKASRLAKKKSVAVYVSRIYLPSGQLEVSLTPPIKSRRLQSTSTLQPGDAVLGVPMLYKPYGIFLRLLPNYNRRGLLHIKKVATALGRYIDPETGLKRFAANFDNQEGIPLVVVANHKRRGLELDVSEEFKSIISEEKRQRDEALSEPSDMVANYDEYGEEYANDTDEYDDDYDEDSEIEDAFGLGTY